jgi:capsular polysaccharide biosynthesis protein
MAAVARDRDDVPGLDLLSAVGRHIVLFACTVLLLAAAGAAFGLVRKPVYTAEARISVGQLNVSVQSVPGFLSAAQGLASGYARAVDAPPVASAAAKAGGVTGSAARDALSATPIPSTPLLRLDADAVSGAQAAAMANAAAKALIAYVQDLNEKANVRRIALTRYRRAAQAVADAGLEVGRAQRAYGRAQTKAHARALRDARAREQVAMLRRSSVGAIYQTAAQGEIAVNLLQLVTPAASAASDRRHVLEEAILIGGFAGLVLGVVLAVWREDRLRRREVAVLRTEPEPAAAPAV